MSTGIEWRCDRCDEPVADGEGAIFVWDQDVNARKVAYEEWVKTQPRGWRVNISSCPSLAAWQTLHHDCDFYGRSSYWFDVARARTLEQVLDWTLHLAAKGWVIEHTDWIQFVRRHVPSTNWAISS